MDYPEILWCKSCCKFVAVDGKLDRQGLKTVCIECGTEVDVVPYSEVEDAVYDSSIKIPSDKILLKWWDSQPKGIYTCSDCGREDREYLIQPQHPAFTKGIEGIALCGDCINRHNEQQRKERKKELDSLPRCEVPGCERRGTWKVAGHTLLCGWHLKNVKRQHEKAIGQAGILGALCFDGYYKHQILEMAVMK